MTIENRLKEERLRLGFTQPDFAALGEKTKKTLIDYEKGATSPDAKFLAAIAEAGADVAYILTGVRSGTLQIAESPAPYGLDPRQAKLLENYRECGEEDRRAIERMALLGSKAEQEADEVQIQPTPRRRIGNETIHRGPPPVKRR